MKIIDLPQGSDDWKLLRLSKITATDVSGILEINPWVTPLDIYNMKWGLKEGPKENDAMRRGKELEPIARQLLIEETGIQFEPIVCTHDTEEWAMASLDGWAHTHIGSTPPIAILRDVICEIKCPNLDTHQFALSGGIKPYYMSQVQWQLWITEASMCYYFSYFPGHGDPIAIVEVYPDKEYIESMVRTCKKFYLDLCNFIPPDQKIFKPRKT